MRRPFFVIAAGFVLGEVFALQIKMAGMEAADARILETAAFGMAVLAWICLAGCVSHSRGSEKKRKGRGRLLPFCVGAIAFSVGVFWAEARISSLEAQERWVKERQEEGSREFVGEIERIEAGSDGWEIWLKNVRENRGQNSRNGDGKPPERLQVQAETLSPQDTGEFFIGRTILVRGEIRRLEFARNPGEFDYRIYYLSQGIAGQISWASAEAVGDHKEMRPYPELLARLRNRWGGLIRSLCREPEAGLFCSVLLGDKRTLDTEIRGLYQKSGIAHLLAISGLHLSILGMGLYRLIRKAGCPILPAVCAACAAILSYGLLIGASGSTRRAIIMVLCAFGADCVGRTYDSLSALGLAAVLITGEQPYQLLQSGFQLSFGAVLGIAWIGSGVSEEWRRWREKNQKKRQNKRLIQIRDSFVCYAAGGFITSLAVQVITAPMIAFHFFRFPVYGILLNMIVIPLMAYVLYSGIIGIVLGSLFPMAGKLALQAGCWIFAFYEKVCRWMEAIPGSSFLTGRPKVWQIGLYYGVVLGIWAAWNFCRKAERSGKKESEDRPARLFWIQAATWMALAVLGPLALRTPAPGELTVTFLDVGQGDGIILQRGGTVILVDGGSTDKKSLGRQTVLPFRESKGISAVDYSIVTHGDQDHISGLLYLLEQGIPVRNLILPGAGRGQAVYEKLEKLAAGQGGAVYYFSQGSRIEKEGPLRFSMTCIYPDQDSPAFGKDETNRHSLVFLLEYGAFRMLLTGDMEGEDEKRLAGQQRLGPVHVLKVAHHGSRFSTTWPLLEKIHPRYAVISYGEGNSYGHPHGETLERLERVEADVFRTGEQGAVILWTDGESMRIDGYLEKKENSGGEKG